MQRKISALITALALALSLTAPVLAAPEGSFRDVAPDAWYAQAVATVTGAGLMNGTGGGAFSPDMPTDRAMVVTILWHAAGEPRPSGDTPPFSDTLPGTWYAQAVTWASEQQVVEGYPDGRFGTGDNLFRPAALASRAETATLFSNWLSTRPGQEPEPQPEPEPEPEPPEDGRILVAYYSATGTTRAVAETIADALGADLFVITPEEPYTEEDLDWNSPDSRVVQEHDNPEGRHVALTTTRVEGFDDCDTVFLGYPIWWGGAAWVVDDFVTANDFTGKTVIPFCTSMSSPLGSSARDLAELCGTGTWLEGMRFSGGTSPAQVEQWLEGLELS